MIGCALYYPLSWNNGYLSFGCLFLSSLISFYVGIYGFFFLAITYRQAVGKAPERWDF